MAPKARTPKHGKSNRQPPSNPTDNIPDSDSAEDYWDSSPIKKARWFLRRLDAVATADSRFVTLCESSAVLVKDHQVAVMDTSHAIDYATNAFVKGTIKKPYIRAAATRAATGTTPNATTARHAALAGAGSPLPSPADRLAALGPEWERRFRFSPEAIQGVAKELMEHFTEYITAPRADQHDAVRHGPSGSRRGCSLSGR